MKPFLTPFYLQYIYIYIYIYILADIPGFTRVFIYPNQTNAHTPIHICIYNIYIRFLYIHIVICVPSLVEIAPGVPELCLSGVIYHQIPH
jgi:uncharacterized membrane protein YoaT (DUF817 family)